MMCGKMEAWATGLHRRRGLSNQESSLAEMARRDL